MNINRFILGLSKPSFYSLPCRTNMYHYALDPIILNREEKVDPEEPRLYKPVRPVDKFTHSGITHDPLYKKFMGIITKKGYRETAREIMRKTFAEIKAIQLAKYFATTDLNERESIEINPMNILLGAVENCKPLLVPAPPIRDSDARRDSIKMLIETAKDKNPNMRIWVTLGRELVSAYHNEGRAIQKKIDLHKKCEENRAYANYRKF